MNPFANKVVEEIRDMWQARALVGAKGKIQRVLLIALLKEYPAAFRALLDVLGIKDISRPLYSGYASIAPSGRIICDLIDRDFEQVGKKKVEVYLNESLFIYDMRKLADELKLDDTDRAEMFTVLQKWVTKDARIGIFGQRLAS